MKKFLLLAALVVLGGVILWQLRSFILFTLVVVAFFWVLAKYEIEK